ncbi:MAG: hypothetical protein JWO86_9228 [Myxococcaceae bacterium]|jgi:hypothetical protein|nr:hypothetical protein [Myxococcaceae bacterium]
MPGYLFWAIEAVGAGCVVHLWMRARGSITKKIVWTPLLLVPALGPLFYGAIYDGPPEQQDEDLRAAETDTDTEDD